MSKDEVVGNSTREFDMFLQEGSAPASFVGTALYARCAYRIYTRRSYFHFCQTKHQITSICRYLRSTIYEYDAPSPFSLVLSLLVHIVSPLA